MGDDYTGPVTVSDEDGSERVLNDDGIWSQSETILEMVKDTDPGDTIPLASVSKEGLDKTIEWMEKHAAFKADSTSDEDKLAWVSEYKKTMKEQDQIPLLFQTMTAANFMNVKPLINELCKHVAEIISLRTPNEILRLFGTEKTDQVNQKNLLETHKWIDPENLITL
jgi:S-phase kinase-associated protein 1